MDPAAPEPASANGAPHASPNGVSEASTEAANGAHDEPQASHAGPLCLQAAVQAAAAAAAVPPAVRLRAPAGGQSFLAPAPCPFPPQLDIAMIGGGPGGLAAAKAILLARWEGVPGGARTAAPQGSPLASH